MVLPDLEAKAKAEIAKNEFVLKQNPRGKINKDHQSALQQWWLHFRSRVDKREAISGLKRCVACSRISKRSVFDFIDTGIVPSDKVQTFIFDDDYSFGILQSNLHWEWWFERGATLKSDPAYTPNSVFDTFPWPQQPTNAQVNTRASAHTATPLSPGPRTLSDAPLPSVT